jgi:hypothetical protein
MPSTNHNATPSASGWDFQYNAAIVIMLENIEEACSIKIEGDLEDIEICLSDGGKIFAQAKSTTTPLNSHNAIGDLSDALETLSEANRSNPTNTRTLIFVTNRPNPFNNRTTIAQFSGQFNYLPFSDLWPPCQNRIQSYCREKQLDLPLDKLFVLVFYFSEDTDDRYTAVRDRINRFLSKLNLSNRGWTDKAFKRWLRDFSANVVEPNHSKVLSKEDIIWPLIVWLCGEEPERRLLEEQYDDATVETIARAYKDIITAKTERFEFVSKVMTGYELFRTENRSLNSRAAQERFLAEKAPDYIDEFDFSDADPNIAKAVVEHTLRIVLRQQQDIRHIKQIVKL